VTHAYERKRGPKDDQRDAFHLAESLRLGAVSPVYKDRGQLSELRAHADVYAKLVTIQPTLTHEIAGWEGEL
ncbi:MAG: hypothetical protein WBN01_02435, partial [Polyangiales bacterium]